MRYLTDCLILLLYCTCSLLFLPIDVNFVTAFFIAVSAGTFLYVFENVILRITVMLLFGAVLFLLPKLALFLPLAVYFFYLPGRANPDIPFLSAHPYCAAGLLYLPALTAAAGLLYQTLPASRPQLLFFVSAGCILSLLLRQKTDSYEKLSRIYRKTRDDDREIELLLQEKNQSLLDKQTYELYAATLKERNRIAREIHDNVGHMLTRSILMVGALKAVNKDNTLTEMLQQLDSTLNSAMNSIRESVHDLHEHSINLEDTLHSLAGDFLFCPIRLHCDISEEAPAKIKSCFIAITKEALVNISRHSNATAAEISVQEHPSFYRLSIKDNGTGLSHAVNTLGRGIGLTNMQSRVDSLGGTLQILTDHGFCIFITIPKTC